MDKSSLACTNSRVPIVVAGLIFLAIFVVNIGLLLWYWSNNQQKRRKVLERKSATPHWFPYAIVAMIGVAFAGLYVMYYIRCDVTAALVTLVLPLLGAIAVAAQWPAYSLNPLVFGYQVAYEQTQNL
jgi:cobalamin synthase